MFNTPSSRRFFAYACTAGGAGLSRIQIHDLYGVLCCLETAAEGSKAFPNRLSSKSGFYMAIRREKRRTLQHMGWSDVSRWDGEEKNMIVFPDALDVVQQCVGTSPALRWTKEDMDVLTHGEIAQEGAAAEEQNGACRGISMPNATLCGRD